MLLASEVLLYWDAIDMEETAVSWSMTVTVKSRREDDFFSGPAVRAHSKIPGLEAAGVEIWFWPVTPDNIVVLECW